MQIKVSDKFKKLFELIINKKLIFSLYSLPNEKLIYLIIQKSENPFIISEFNKYKGFIITPFNLNKDKYIIFPDILVSNEDIIDNYIFDELSEIPERSQINLSKELKCLSKYEFISKINTIKNLFKEDESLKKVVFSRVENFKVNNNFSVFDFFIKLKEKYSNAFIFLFSVRPDELWIGSSPEPFLLVNKNNSYTFSIAGTQIFQNLDIENVIWSDKDILEQKIVSTYIENILKNNLNLNIELEGPITHQAGNLIHLKTIFHIKDKNIFDKINDIIYKLHPTPSISGYPKEKAIDIIQKLEEYDRDLYSGIIGPLNINNRTDLFINIRSLKKINNNLWFFQGAGIIENSIPEKEWEETENKKMTLLSIILKMVKYE